MGKRKISKAEKREREEIKETVDAFVHPKYPGFNSVKLGLAGGIVTGFCFMFTMIAHLLKGGFPKWTELILEAYGSVGVGLTYTGSVLSGIYGFIDAFIILWIFAVIYNKLLK